MIRNPIPWPDGARCAVAFTFDMDGESLMHVGHADTIAPTEWLARWTCATARKSPCRA